MLMGTAARTDRGDVRTAYLRRQTEAEQFVNFADFLFFKMDVLRVHLVAGFGRIVDLKPEDILTDVSDAQALVEAEGDAIAHMNDDHAEACRLYATKLLGAPDGDWRCVGIDPEGTRIAARPRRLAAVFPATRYRAGPAARGAQATRRRGAGTRPGAKNNRPSNVASFSVERDYGRCDGRPPGERSLQPRASV